MKSPDDCITAHDKKMHGFKNHYLAVTELYAPEMMIKCDVFQLPNTKTLFVDVVIHLNRVYRRRISNSPRSKIEGRETREFKTFDGVFSTFRKHGIENFSCYFGEEAIKMIEKLEKEFDQNG